MTEPRSPAPKQHRNKGIYILPNLFTTASLFSGFYAIVQAGNGNFENAAIAILVSMVLDGLDGRVARLTNTVSDFGAEYDSLADVIAFGLAPALVMYEWSLHALGKPGWLVSFTYVACTALRLARFNTRTAPDKGYFQGMPCPAAAAFAATWIWTVATYEVGGAFVSGTSLLITFVLAFVMVSNLPYYSFKEFDLKNKVPFVGMLAVLFVFVLISFDPPRVLFVMLLIYLVSGFVMWFLKRREKSVTAILHDEIEEAEMEADDSVAEAVTLIDDAENPTGSKRLD